ncbi:hypothetical protein VIBC2010_07649 [Vibrio caribbeanicus ATCC BAA-2122]|uniref:Uncharacterized protein n=1 Tax=Vibrio caribbeanicus ATCC BAA-2122 TaxID=796620 RepID=E3BJQ7_9VIBR|nr:hypothetical protein VIBC2010_07649 [Vibrio caribbeanicus ATCC BAA-2122]
MPSRASGGFFAFYWLCLQGAQILPGASNMIVAAWKKLFDLMAIYQRSEFS